MSDTAVLQTRTTFVANKVGLGLDAQQVQLLCPTCVLQSWLDWLQPCEREQACLGSLAEGL